MNVADCKPGVAVLYQPSVGPDRPKYRGIVREPPWQLGSGTWVTHLSNMEAAYGADTGRPERTTVHAAAVGTPRGRRRGVPMTDQIQELLTVAARSERRAVSAGRRQGDRLLRALVPLYLLRKTHGPLALNSGDLHRFWEQRSVRLGPANARGALWCWIGYARHVARPRPQDGWVITPNGIRYVEEAVRRG